MKSSKRYYLLIVEGDTEPVLSAPFQTRTIRDGCAAAARGEDPELKNGIFWIDVEAVDNVKIGSYSGAWSEKAIAAAEKRKTKTL